MTETTMSSDPPSKSTSTTASVENMRIIAGEKQRTNGNDEEKAHLGDVELPLNAVAQGPVRTMSGWKWTAVVIAILSSTFLFALDNTIVASIQPTIVRDFGQVNELTWVSVGLVMSASATVLLWGKMYGQFNTKWSYIISVFLFEVGSAVCGAAPNINALIVGRVICGIGGSGLYIGVISLLASQTTMQERPMYIASTGLTWGLGLVLGPIIGGAFTESSVGWRWSFYINLLVGAACAPVYVFLIPNVDPRRGVSFMKRAAELDYVGAVLNTGAFVSGVMAISFGGVTWPWNSGKIIGLFVCSAVLFILFGLQQSLCILTTKARRVFPVEHLKSRTMLILFVATACAATACFVPIFMIPIFFQYTRGDSALASGIRLLPFIILCVFAIMMNGGVLSAYGYYMPWYAVGGALCLTGGALFYTVNENTSVARVYGYSIIAGFGVGLFLQASFSVAQASVTPAQEAGASGFITCSQVVGTTIALAISTSLFLNKAQQGIARALPDAPLADIQQAIAGAGSNFVSSLSAEKRQEVLHAIVSAQGQTYILVITAGSLMLLLSLAMKRERLFMQPPAAV